MTTTLLHDLIQDTPLGVHMCDSAEELSAIHRPGVAAVVWQRNPMPSFLNWIEGLPPQSLPSARVILRPEAVRDTVCQICDSAGIPDCDERTYLIDDIAALADIFAGVMQTKWLRLRLDVVTTNACRKFHVDAVIARLVCTYRGTGTQYGTAKDDNDPEHIVTVPSCAPLLLRGTLWPEHPRSGLLHRSPPIEGCDETRLLLVLDPISDPKDEV